MATSNLYGGASDEYLNAFGINPSTGTYNNSTTPISTAAPATTTSSSNLYGGASDEYLKAFGINPSTGTYNSTTPTTTTPSLANTTSNTGNSSSYTSSIPSYQPTPPANVAPPVYDYRLRDMFVDTFNNPNKYWNEYNQGQGVNFTQGAARAMAKAGRTGMLPTLGSLAHQDYMSNYLPSVRKDMSPGLSYETAGNQNLTQKYGQDLDYSKGIYGTDVTKYGQNLDYNSAMAEIAAKKYEVDQNVALKETENLLKNLDINETTKRQIYQTFSQIYKDVPKDQQAAFLEDFRAELGMINQGNETLADITSPNLGTSTTGMPAPTTPTLPPLYEYMPPEIYG